MHEVLWRQLYRTVQNMYQVLSMFQIEATNPTPKHKRIFLMHLNGFQLNTSLRGYGTH